MTRAGTNCYGLSLSKLILKMLAFSRRGRLLSPSSQARRGVVVRRRRAKLRPVHALSLTSWFRVPSQMERSELLSRASCFFVPSSADGALHVVGSSHVVAPWRWRGYYPQEWVAALDASHVTLSAELRDEERGHVLASFDVEPEVVHHASRDACVMRLAASPSDVMREAEKHGCAAIPLTLRGKDAAPLPHGEQLYFEGFEVQENSSEDGGGGDDDEVSDEDTRALVPLRSEGRLSISSARQAFAETATVLPLGMCGSPVMCVATGEAIGMVEGVVPPLSREQQATASELRKRLTGSAVYVDAAAINDLVATVEAAQSAKAASL